MSETKDWRKICAACHEGEPPKDCEYYGEPNGCNSPTYGKHPTCDKSSQVGNAAPLRNCDVGSVEEQYARFKKWCEGEFYKRPMNPLTGEPCKSCPCYSVSANGVDGCNYLRWAQMQYKKEGEA